MDLALEQQRIDHRAEIVDDGVALDLHVAGIGIDLDLGDVAAVGKRFGGGRPCMSGVEPRLHAGRQLRWIARRRRDREQIDAPVGADDAKLALAELDVGG